MFYHTEAKPQGWRGVAVFDDRTDRLLYLGRSSTQVRAQFATAFYEVLDEEEREPVPRSPCRGERRVRRGPARTDILQGGGTRRSARLHRTLRGRKMTPYSSLCDDFGVYVYLTTKMDLPSGRETVLHFFEGLRKTY